MPVLVDRLAQRVADALSTPDGQARLAAAVGQALELEGAPTRPGGPPGLLRDRWAAGDPLCEDTDWSCPLGPFRDTRIMAGSLGELCSARLADCTFAIQAVVHALDDMAASVGADELASALDEAEARDARVAALERVLLGPLRDLPLRRLV